MRTFFHSDLSVLDKEEACDPPPQQQQQQSNLGGAGCGLQNTKNPFREGLEYFSFCNPRPTKDNYFPPLIFVFAHKTKSFLNLDFASCVVSVVQFVSNFLYRMPDRMYQSDPDRPRVLLVVWICYTEADRQGQREN